MEKKKILLVDDDQEFIKGFAEKLRTAGFDVVTTYSGEEALDYLRDNVCDFIVLDFIMPEMDGYTFYHILTHDMNKTIPTIILTNLFLSEKDKPEGLASLDKLEGLQVFTKEEVSLDFLIERIKNYLSSSQPPKPSA